MSYILLKHPKAAWLAGLAAVLLALAPMFFFQASLKWDALDISLPWRYFMGGALQTGHLPLWLPYQSGGHPFYIDNQSWYPLAWLIGWAFGYGYYVFHAEYLLHLLLAFGGMFFLGKTLKISASARIVAAVAYTLSGFMIGNGQHLGWIYSAAWLPWVFGAFILLLREADWQHALGLALTEYLFFTAGYPAFFATTQLLLLMYGLLWVWRERPKVRDAGFVALAAFLFLLMAGFAVYAILEAKPFIARGDAVPLHKALEGSLTLRSLLSLLLPFAVAVEPGFWKTDVSFANAYFGLLPLALACLFILRKHSWQWWFWWGAGLFGFAMALGDVLPLRTFFYHFVPTFDMYRFPALFRLFGIFGLVLAGARMWDLAVERENVRRWLSWLVLGFAGITAFLLIQILMGEELSSFSIKKLLTNTQITGALAKEHVLLQAPVQLVFLAVLWLLLRQKHFRPDWVLAVMLLDLVIASRLNGPFTQYSVEDKAKPANIQATLSSLPEGWPLPVEKPFGAPAPKPADFSPLWQNLGVYLRQPEYYGYNPYILKSYNQFDEGDPAVKVWALQKPLAYLTKGDYVAANTFREKLYDDTTAVVAGGSIIWKAVEPNRFELKATTQEESYLVLQQNDYLHWKASVGNSRANIFSVNEAWMAIKLPSGQHEVEFKFEAPWIKFGYVWSLGVFGLCGLFWAWGVIKRKRTMEVDERSV